MPRVATVVLPEHTRTSCFGSLQSSLSGLITRRRGALATWASWMERGLSGISACAESVLDRRSRQVGEKSTTRHKDAGSSLLIVVPKSCVGDRPVY